MELIGAEKSWEWSRKVRNASLEKAEQMVEDGLRLQKKQVGNIFSFSNYVILKFYCRNCRTKHFWGGPRKYLLSVDKQQICPKNPKGGWGVFLDRKFDNVHPEDALYYAPREIKKVILKDLHTLNPFIKK